MSTAIVVGCSGYEDPDISPLRYAHIDANLVAEVFKEVCGLQDSEVVLLADNADDPRMRPTRTNILRNLTSSGRAEAGELTFFFFSGHGFQSAQDGAQYLLPVDCVRGALEETSLRFDSVMRHLQDRDPRHVLLFLDACRNNVEGGKAGPNTDVSHVDVAALCPPGMVSFCSCEPGRVSYEAEGLASGIFTAALCEGLSDTGRCRTIYELDAYLAARVPEIAATQGKPLQRPYTRVEPLGVQRLEIVSDRKRNQWRATTPIGAEQRTGQSRSRAMTSSQEEPILGIDFGTSYSAVSWCDGDGNVHLVPGADTGFLVPSLINFLPSLDYLVGAAAQEADYFNPGNTIHHVKRLLGTDTVFEIEGRSIVPELTASLIIRSLWRRAADALGTRGNRCIAAYPANFSLAQRNALERAFEMADLDVMRMIAEPNIAALTIQDLTAGPKDGPYMIIDLGGGTFDVAAVSVDDGVYELMAAGGSSTLGGLDFDDAISRYAQGYLREHLQLPEGVLSARLGAQVRREAGRVKRELGFQPAAAMILQDIEVDSRGLRDVSIPIDRDLFRDLTRDLNTEIRNTVEQVLRDYRDQRYSSDTDTPAVFLAGQGTKIFTVREQLEALGLTGGYISEYQETAVVNGLGRQAGVLSGRVRNSLLLNIAQDGIGIRCKLYDRPARGDKEAYALVSADPRRNSDEVALISRYTTIPTVRHDIFTFEGAPGQYLTLEFVEFRVNGVEAIGQVRIPADDTDNDVELKIDIEADGTILATVTSERNMQKRRYQLNNLYRDGRDWAPFGELEAALLGYSVWPLRPITDPDPVPPGVLSAENAAAHIQQYERRVATLAKDSPILPRELVRRGMAYQLAGDAGAAQEDYLRVIDGFRAYASSAAQRLASLLPRLPDRSRALNGLIRAREQLKQSELTFASGLIAAELRNAGETALAASFTDPALRTTKLN